jgi:hypothetical protein|tara:strand:+ start:167 stop:331 length:165 start_codon:yes stop_codon:yes gene_type:complete
MNKTVILSILYFVGILLGEFIFGLWSENTTIKSIIVLIWTAIFLIALVYSDKDK